MALDHRLINQPSVTDRSVFTYRGSYFNISNESRFHPKLTLVNNPGQVVLQVSLQVDVVHITRGDAAKLRALKNCQWF